MPDCFHGILPDGTEISVPVRVSSRCKRIILRARGDGFEIVIPPRGALTVARAFFNAHLNWIARVIVKRGKIQSEQEQKKVIPNEIFLAFTGEYFPIIYQPLEACWTGVRLENGTLIVSGQTGTYELCSAGLRQWLIRYAEAKLLPHALEIAENHGFSGLTKLRTGLQKCSWGTCTRKGVVTLNAALLFFTKPLVEYVILHEFCHLTELNHSARFWAKLESVYPGAKEARETLKSAAKLLPGWVTIP